MKILNESYDDDMSDVYAYSSLCELRIPIKIRTEFPAFQVGDNGANDNQIKDAIEDYDFLEKIKDVLNRVVDNGSLSIYSENDDMIYTDLEHVEVEGTYIHIENILD